MKPVDIHDESRRESEDSPIYFRPEMPPEQNDAIVDLQVPDSDSGGVSAHIENQVMETERPVIMEPGSLRSSPR